METDHTMKWKDPWFAVCLSWFIPGTGQIYANRKILGIILIVVYLALVVITGYVIFEPSMVMWWAIGAFALILLFRIWNVFNAHRITRKSNANLPSDTPKDTDLSKKPWLAAFLSYLWPGLGQFYAKKWIKGIIFIIVYLALGKFSYSYQWGWLFIGMAIYDNVVVYDAWHSVRNQIKESKKAILIFLLVVTLCALLFKAILISTVYVYIVPASSMQPTIMRGDRIITERLTYLFAEPKYGDIVVFKSVEDSKALFMKRLVGKGGDTIQIRDNAVYLNGKLFKQYHSTKQAEDYGPYTVPENKYFLIGDFLSNSRDSRHYGPISREDIISRVIKIYWPAEHTKNLE